MANLFLNIGPLSVTVVLFICATFLIESGNPEGSKFFNLGVYSGVWNLLWSAAQLVVRRTLGAEEEYRGRLDSASVLLLYLLAILICTGCTALFAYFIFQRH